MLIIPAANTQEMSAAPLPADRALYDGTLGSLLKTLSGLTEAIGVIVNQDTNDLGQGPH
ncbi:hypothetical protein H4R26_001729 [Coemansia thaxteri]|uniref:Uncharacterized protein n=1 Tax=Coemansia thaxteri TaxID=2663907 RepID=A0A9W8EK83_9FUNG|nr:hypothetical protein H4R26_001729 [Coemansia thaxteri]